MLSSKWFDILPIRGAFAGRYGYPYNNHNGIAHRLPHQGVLPYQGPLP